MSSAMNGSTPRGAVLFRMEMAGGTSPADIVTLWLGVGDLDVPANDLVLGVETYSGLGALGGIPVLEQLINGAFSRAEFTLNAVPAEIAALANAEASLIRNALVNVGLLELDEEWQPTGDVFWVWDGIADVLRTSRTTTPDGSQTHVVTLSVGSAMTGRKRPTLEFWTDAQQKRRSPTDRGLERVPPAEAKKHWPN